MELQVIDKNNKKVSTIAVSDEMGLKPSQDVLYYAVKAARNNLHHGTACVKDRSDINKTNKKIYRQKGTGNARHASRRANIFVGGASAFGPHPRSFGEHVNKKFKKRSYQEVFKYLIQGDKIRVLNEINFDKPSTKAAKTFLSKIGLTKAVVFLSAENENAKKSFRNLKDVSVMNENNLSLYEILRHDAVVMTEVYFTQVKERYGL
ncbi:MAG: 50S ribosomal protein L4 [uncultured bacterium]|nr:MAG: 50S ribosomal protein L4 [uncultured bacterium]HLD44951.1 50S ribosomal protein L4 [bacterium]